MTADDLQYRNSKRAQLASRRENWARRDRERELSCYDDCLAAVFKIKTDVFTHLARDKEVRGESATVKDWMVAMAEDIEDEILRRKAACLEKEKSR